MDIQEFAENHSLKVKMDSCGETIIPGKPRNLERAEDRRHIYENGDGRFGVSYVHAGPVASVGKYHNAQKRMLEAGFTQGQNGDAEGTFLFDPANETQAKIAIREIGARMRREASPERRIVLAANLVKARAAKQSDPSVFLTQTL